MVDDVRKVEMRVGKIADIQYLPEARKPSCRLAIKFGVFGTIFEALNLGPLWTPIDSVVGNAVKEHKV